ncbi:selection and upkeep of intraepithelial T-cells protein 1-like [Microcaecilia unicolor]|uniref:Selection and upkeep of intraepithelial T-cells protein 1-like n=1 Tax=Microcaecilia unicolor TaxID=1415580 RepID=A0A6P7YPP9_9AMPH|nr:selection and upkeep of intraepithelial T-cells protein 1-like [Microcaecilia unicolor]
MRAPSTRRCGQLLWNIQHESQEASQNIWQQLLGFQCDLQDYTVALASTLTTQAPELPTGTSEATIPAATPSTPAASGTNVYIIQPNFTAPASVTGMQLSSKCPRMKPTASQSSGTTMRPCDRVPQGQQALPCWLLGPAADQPPSQSGGLISRVQHMQQDALMTVRTVGAPQGRTLKNFLLLQGSGYYQQLRDGSTLNIHRIYYAHYNWHLSEAENFKLISPDYPVVVILGEDVVLLCHLSPPINATNMEVRWFRTRFESLVHLYDDGKDQNNRQLPEYQGRTELIRDHISSGNVSLRIHSVRLKDEGRYICHVRSNIYYQDAELELKVTGMGSAPRISKIDCQDREMRAVCESTGWYPEPEVIWRQKDGQSLTPLSEIKIKQNGLFNVKTSLSVTISKRSNFSCCIRNIILSQERASTISISDHTNNENHQRYGLIAAAVFVAAFDLCCICC